MTKRNKKYWQKRAEYIATTQFKKTDEYIASITKEYEKAMFSIQRDVITFYERFAANNEITLHEAKKLLSGNELKEFKMTLEEFTNKAKNNVSGKWEKELNNVSYKVRVSRLEVLQTQIQQQIEMLTNKQQKGMNDLLSDVYEDTYYRNIYEVHKGLGISTNFAKLDKNTIEKAINQQWLEGNFSSRVWNNRSKLINELKTRLVQSFIRGDQVDKTAKILAKRMNVSKNRAITLINTESSYITNKATMDSYKSSGVVKQYEILATLDTHTSPICRSMDGNKVSEMQPGVNAPPFHPRCRTTTIAYFPDAVDEKRIARDSEGNNYYVDGDITYKDWYNKYVKNNKVNKNNSTWDNFKIKNRQFSSKKEISKYLKNEYNIKFSDSRKYPIHKDLLQGSINWLDKFHSYFKGFKGIDPVKLPAFKVKARVNAVGYYSYYPNKPEAVELALNGLYFTDKDSNMEYIEKCIKSRWTVSNAKGYKTFIHEYGHHVANSLKWLDKENNKVSKDWCKQFINNVIEDYNKQYNKNVEFKDIPTLVSRYGGTKPVEAFAETFTEAFGGDNPRKFAQVFRNKVEEKLKYHIKRKKG